MKAIILAAGKGTRLQCENTDIPKALRLANGKPLISYVLDNLRFLAPEDITIVVGFLKEKIIEVLGPRYHYVEQTQIDGTAHATLYAEPLFANDVGPVMVLYCDMPLLRETTYRRMFERHIATGADSTLLAGRLHPIPEFGRLIRDADGTLLDIIEHSACTPAQQTIDEVNVGIQVFNTPDMWHILRQIRNNNPKHEYYLTSAAGILAQEHKKQEVVYIEDPTEA
ncbi:MAG: NTP transferase domain-containing protein, partial [Clostridia bacterium]